jgi:hypothetical protein
MESIQLNEEPQFASEPQAQQGSLLVRMVIATKLVTTEKAANRLLIAIAVVLFLLAGMFYVMPGDKQKVEMAPGTGLITTPGQPPRLGTGSH